MMAYASWSVVFGEQPSAAKWNILGTNDASFNDGTGIANLRIGSGFTSLKHSYKFLVYRSAAFNVPNPAALLPFDTKVYDTGTNIDVVTNKGRFTAPVTGFYTFSASVNLNAGGAVQSYVALYKNGSLLLMGSETATGTGNYGNAVTWPPISLTAADYVEVFAFASSLTTINTGATSTYFGGYLLCQT